MSTHGVVRVAGFLVSLGAFVLVRTMTRGLPWWLSLLLAIAAMLVAGRLAGVAAADIAVRVTRHRAQRRAQRVEQERARQSRGAITRW